MSFFGASYFSGGQAAPVTLVAGAARQVGSLSIDIGDSYLNSDGTEKVIAKDDAASWPADLTGGSYSILFTCTPTEQTLRDDPSAAGFTSTGAVVDATHVRLGDWAKATTAALSKPRGNGVNTYSYTIAATTATVQHTLESGLLSVL